MTIKSYKIIEAYTAGGLEDRVAAWIAEGWFPIGGVCQCVDRQATTLFAQAIGHEDAKKEVPNLRQK